MNCEKCMENLQLYIDNQLSESEAAEVTAHLAACEHCRAEYEALKAVIERVKNIGEKELPTGFHEEVMHKLRASNPQAARKENPKATWGGFRRYVPAAASVVAMMFVLGTALGVVSDRTGQNMAIYNVGQAMPEAASAADVTAEAAPTAPLAVPAPKLATAPTMGKVEVQAQMRDIAADEGNTITGAGDMGYVGEALIKTYSVSIKVDDFDAALAAVNALPGYNEGMNSQTYTGDIPNANINRRVESTQYEYMKTVLEGMGEVTYTDEYTQRVTDVLSDLQAQERAKQEEVTRLFNILEGSDSVAYMTAVEARLEQTSSELDSIRSQMMQFNAQTSLSMLNIHIYTEAPSREPIDEPTFIAHLQQNFLDSVNGSIRTMENFAVFVSTVIVPLIVLAVVGVIVFAIVKAVKNKKRKGGGRDEE